MPPSHDAVGKERGHAPRSLPRRPEITLDHMFLRGVEAFGYHGVFDSERRSGQRFIVDVDWWLETSLAISTDLLDATICYKQLYDCVLAVIAGERTSLIEKLADNLIATLFAWFPTIEIVKVTVHKPEAPIGGVFGDVGIGMMRHRRDRCSSSTR